MVYDPFNVLYTVPKGNSLPRTLSLWLQSHEIQECKPLYQEKPGVP